MDINYASIIEKANQRKNALMQLAELVNQSGERLVELDRVAAFMSKMNNVYSTLDAEGRAMLPPALKVALDYGSGTQSWLGSARLNRISETSTSGLSIIAKHASEGI